MIDRLERELHNAYVAGQESMDVVRGGPPPDRDQRAALRWAVWMGDGDPFRRAQHLVDNADDALRWLLVQGALDGRPIDL